LRLTLIGTGPACRVPCVGSVASSASFKVRAGAVLRGFIGACLTWSRHCVARSAARHAPAVILSEGAVIGMAKKPRQRRITGGVDTHKDTHRRWY
jgi:hypothetical protein